MPPYYKTETELVKVTATRVYCKQEKHAYTWQLKEKAVVLIFLGGEGGHKCKLISQINESPSPLVGRGLGTTQSILILSNGGQRHTQTLTNGLATR